MSETDKVIAKPSGACCLQGNIHEGTPQGTRETIAGVDTYISKPPEGRANGHIVAYFPDIWGFFNNAFLIMDGFAQAGYLTLGLDFLRGESINASKEQPDFDWEAWLAKHQKFADRATPEWVQAVKQQYGTPDTKIACVGYCFGAPYAMDELSSSGTCVAGAFAHPAFLKESHFKNLTKPLLMSCAEIDPLFTNEFRNRAVDILQEGQKKFELQLFQGIEHGFALRGDVNKPWEKYTKEQSLKAIVDWFDFWTSQ